MSMEARLLPKQHEGDITDTWTTSAGFGGSFVLPLKLIVGPNSLGDERVEKCTLITKPIYPTHLI